MNEIVARNMQLPDDLKELSKFVLIGRDAVDKVKAEIRAIDKLKLSNEVRKQKLEEGQYLAELVLDAEVQIGKLTAAIPKATKGTGSNQYKKAEIDNNVEFSKPKSEALREIGIQQKQAERYERLAKHPEAVQLAKVKAKETDRFDILNNPFRCKRDYIKICEYIKNKDFISESGKKAKDSLDLINYLNHDLTV